jgi:uncharacterized 2Fe-2S/4Fe-4S cluster protein (DUF4445 family)
LAEAVVSAMGLVHQEAGFVPPGPDDLHFDHPVLRTLASVLRNGDWSVTVAVWNDTHVIDIRPGYHDASFGAAVDIGSTAIALYLCDLQTGEVVDTQSMMNPQTSFGDDIMSRMTYERDNDDGLRNLNSALVDALNRLLRQACRSQRIALQDVLEIVVVGNTVMHHFFLNLPTEHLGLAPYVPTLHRAVDVKARDVGIDVGPSANVHLLPITASFVGADNIAVLIAEEPHKQSDEVLIIDVGTNAELVLGNEERLLCTSTPTGPAFEGAHIEYGMRAAPGAIEHVTIDSTTLEPTCQVVGADEDDADLLIKGLCGSAIIDAVAEMFRTGIIDARGRFVTPTPSSRVRWGEFGLEYVIAWEDETSIGREIPITTQDVRQIQLAKAALYTAAQILLREAGLEKPDRIVLAGSFGSRIDKTKALILGMIPDCPLEAVSSVGNSAGDGARIALLNRAKRTEAVMISRRLRRVELPVEPSFQDEFMLALNLPHMSHSFASIADLIPEYEPDFIAKMFTGRLDAV